MEFLTEGDIVIWLIGQIVLGAAIWGAIRTDIKHIHLSIGELKESVEKGVQSAHKRIDLLYLNGGRINTVPPNPPRDDD